MRAILRWTYLKFKHSEGWRSESEAWGRAVAIQRSLHRRGITGRRVMTAPEFVREMKRITQTEVANALRRSGVLS